MYCRLSLRVKGRGGGLGESIERSYFEYVDNRHIIVDIRVVFINQTR